MRTVNGLVYFDTVEEFIEWSRAKTQETPLLLQAQNEATESFLTMPEEDRLAYYADAAKHLTIVVGYMEMTQAGSLNELVRHLPYPGEAQLKKNDTLVERANRTLRDFFREG